MKKKIRIGALISGGGTNLQAIIDACEDGRIDGRVVFVGTDTPKARGLERSARHGIPFFAVDYSEIIQNFKAAPHLKPLPSDFDLALSVKRQSLFSAEVPSDKVEYYLSTRAIAEAALLKCMADYPIDLLVLAGFMRTLSPYFIDRVNVYGQMPKIMNIHPALLPSFAGTDGYGDTFRYGCKVGGCTVHFVDYGEDSGPIIGQRAFPITPDDTLDAIREKGLKEEWQLYPECIQLFAENRLEIISSSIERKGYPDLVRRVVRILSPYPDGC
jgi:phosphoribosylglycinamide formyltransferase 1